MHVQAFTIQHVFACRYVSLPPRAWPRCVIGGDCPLTKAKGCSIQRENASKFCLFGFPCLCASRRGMLYANRIFLFFIPLFPHLRFCMLGAIPTVKILTNVSH
uniref:Uncharacterized protein n=1 Tax=Trypanosoma vivax (strain Y486) TaxID=1055687 RepID=G0U2M6_TRYVY|nr:hypothetical protein TVY486_0903500 [Trypanosoma vivax Y486]